MSRGRRAANHSSRHKSHSVSCSSSRGHSLHTVRVLKYKPATGHNTAGSLAREGGKTKLNSEMPSEKLIRDRSVISIREGHVYKKLSVLLIQHFISPKLSLFVCLLLV